MRKSRFTEEQMVTILREVSLKNGLQVLIRPSRASDVQGLQDIFYHLPPHDIYTRFMTGLKSLPVSEAEHLCNVDYENEMAFVAVTGGRSEEKIVGVLTSTDVLRSTSQGPVSVLRNVERLRSRDALPGFRSPCARSSLSFPMSMASARRMSSCAAT